MAALLVLWVLLSGKFDVFHIGVGVVCVALLAWLQSKLAAFRRPGDPMLRPVAVALYGFWLFWQMLVSAWYVAKWIIGPQSRLDPHLFAFRCRMPSEVNSVSFANSITLTPGTLTVELEDDVFVVHALMPDTEADVLRGEMAGRVARLSDPTAQPKVERLEFDENGEVRR